jgi:heme/copper-type cytochrome/quinol oxidase subunit 2
VVDTVLSNGFFFFLGVLASSTLGYLGNEYVSLKYIDADRSNTLKIAAARERSWRYFSFMMTLYFIIALIIFIVNFFF